MMYAVKPILSEFLPMEETRQPRWATELMARYWLRKERP
jgi:hypothetical protein